MLDCYRPRTPQGPDAKDCFHSWEGGPFLPGENSKLLSLGRGDPATPCDHTPAAQTYGINGIFSSSFPLSAKVAAQGPKERPSVPLLAQKRPFPSALPSPLPSHVCCSKAGATWRGPHRVRLVPSWRPVARGRGERRARVLWDNGIVVWEFSASRSPCSQNSLNPFPWF